MSTAVASTGSRVAPARATSSRSASPAVPGCPTAPAPAPDPVHHPGRGAQALTSPVPGCLLVPPRTDHLSAPTKGAHDDRPARFVALPPCPSAPLYRLLSDALTHRPAPSRRQALRRAAHERRRSADAPERHHHVRRPVRPPRHRPRRRRAERTDPLPRPPLPPPPPRPRRRRAERTAPLPRRQARALAAPRPVPGERPLVDPAGRARRRGRVADLVAAVAGHRAARPRRLVRRVHRR